jgi:hypothetical protein
MFGTEFLKSPSKDSQPISRVVKLDGKLQTRQLSHEGVAQA